MKNEWKFDFLREFTRELILNTPYVLSIQEVIAEKSENLEEEFEKTIEEIIKEFNLKSRSTPLNKEEFSPKDLKSTVLEKKEIEKEEKMLPSIAASIQQSPTPEIPKKEYTILHHTEMPIKAISPSPNIEFVRKEIEKKELISPVNRISSQQSYFVGDAYAEIMKIMSDPRVNILECPGPNKFLLVKTATRIMMTKIKLSEEQIKYVVEKFSLETKIPIIGGLFRAMKDNLIITAVISEIAGSRFIIKKVYQNF